MPECSLCGQLGRGKRFRESPADPPGELSVLWTRACWTSLAVLCGTLESVPVIEEFWFRRDIFVESYVRWASGFKMRHSHRAGAARRVGEFRVELSVDMSGKKFRGTRLKARARRSRLHRDRMGWASRLHRFFA